MTAAETADMQRLLDEMKKEDAESAEQSARRDAEQVARARAIEQEQKRKAEENQRKAAEKKARQRIMAKERREAEAAAKLSKEEARLQQAEIRRRKRNEQKQAWARPAPVYESEKEEEWTLSEHLTRTCERGRRWYRRNSSRLVLGAGLLLFLWAAITEILDPTYPSMMGLAGRHIYPIPIGQKATAQAAEATCNERGLNLVTHSMKVRPPRDTLTPAWAGGCSSESILSFSGEFCGTCTYAGGGHDRCTNLAVWYGAGSGEEGEVGKVAGNPGGVFSWDVSERTDMKALCMEKDLRPENRVVLDSAHRRIPGMTQSPNEIKQTQNLGKDKPEVCDNGVGELSE